MGTDHPRDRRQRQLMGLAALALLGACAPTPPPVPDDHIAIHLRVTRQGTSEETVFAQCADARHLCTLPHRQAHARADGRTDRWVHGYWVTFGPDFPPGTDLGADAGSPFPGAAFFGPQRRFQLAVLPEPGQEEADGPVRLGRGVVAEVSAGQGIYRRQFAPGDLPGAGFVTVDPDMRGGRFLLRGLERQLHHNRAPEDDVIAVSGSWRCPRP